VSKTATSPKELSTTTPGFCIIKDKNFLKRGAEEGEKLFDWKVGGKGTG